MPDSEVAELGSLLTERSDPRFADIDQLSIRELAERMNATDREVPAAVGRAIPAIAATIEGVVARMASGGRLIYAGAGTSGRLAVLDAAECPPTFNTAPGQVQAVMAGGVEALTGPVEDAEDDAAAGTVGVAALGVTAADVVVGLTASGRTPFVLAAVAEAGRRGALTVGVSCNVSTPLSEAVDHPIEVLVGPELLAGSTRLKAGTAQKLVLNMISTITMVRLGKTYGNLMVDMRATNHKLIARATRIVSAITGVPSEQARDALERGDDDLKTAVVMLQRRVDLPTAQALLARSGGRLAVALDTAQE